MGKASKWFCNILGMKKHDPTPSSRRSLPSALPTSKLKRRWSFVKCYCFKESQNDTVKLNSFNGNQARVDNIMSTECEDPDKHVIAVAAASAAAAEAAVAAVHAAAAVVRLTSSSGRCGNYSGACVGGCGGARARDELAAIKIQSAFRGYLARRALRALRSLVRLQALVRGHIERKRTAEWLRRMQALLRAQARARAGRAQISESSESSGKSSHFHHPGPSTPEKFEHSIRSNNAKCEVSSVLKRNGSKSNSRVIDDHDEAHTNWNWSDRRSKDQKGLSTRIGSIEDEKGDKNLEIDTRKLHFTTKRRTLFHSSHLNLSSDQYTHTFTTSKDSTTRQTVPSPSSCEVQSLKPVKLSHEVEEGSFCTAENSPQFFSASSRDDSSKRNPFTPTNSYSSQSCLTCYSDHPNYMAYTESSRAKVRSLSAPKQRPQYERSSSAKRYSVHGFGESKSTAERFSSLHANFTNKAYPGSGRLDSFGMPVGYRC